MTECRYCGTEAPKNDDVHRECRAELVRRSDEGLCYGCGKPAATLDDGTVLSRCGWCVPTEYEGYPGGSA